MQLITHQIHTNKLSNFPFKVHIQPRYDSLMFDTDTPQNIILVEAMDNIIGPDYAFIKITSDGE